MVWAEFTVVSWGTGGRAVEWLHDVTVGHVVQECKWDVRFAFVTYF